MPFETAAQYTVAPAVTNPWPTDAKKWQAVQARDASADGAFFFAVKTTGIFCRPSCRSRAPRPQNVEFFDSVALAVRAGYRACLRCRPGQGAVDPHAAALVQACRLLEEEREEAMPLADIASTVGLSLFHFHRVFKRRLGVTPAAYRRGVLADRARVALASGTRVSDAVYEAGYSSSSRFYEGVGRQLGMSPKAAQAGAPGERIEFAKTTSSLGPVLIGWTGRGVCHVGFEADEAVLRARFPKATFREVKRGPYVLAVKRVIAGAPAQVQVPLDVRGTAFQVRVWEALRQIPTGETRSYTEVAEALGAPQSARAVARACALNSLAVLVPCHRVVRTNHALAGYRWGLPRKRALLKRELATR